ncbi:hypothetical protein [Sporolactobacillus putidus]|nr:hypothetical protein [Sporolactobacillus putidus]
MKAFRPQEGTKIQTFIAVPAVRLNHERRKVRRGFAETEPPGK